MKVSWRIRTRLDYHAATYGSHVDIRRGEGPDQQDMGESCRSVLHNYTRQDFSLTVNACTCMQADFGSDLTIELYVDPSVVSKTNEKFCRVLYAGQILQLAPADANGVCPVRALRGWLEAEGLLLHDVGRWNALCKTAASRRLN